MCTHTGVLNVFHFFSFIFSEVDFPTTESTYRESIKKVVLDPELQSDIDDFLNDCLNDGSLVSKLTDR